MLDSSRVDEIFMDCLFRDGEDHSEFIKAEGLVNVIGFHPGRLSGYKDEIYGFLVQLPVEFMCTGGGGWSFLNACNDKDGKQWTGSHGSMEQLFQLGIGIGAVECLHPREIWPMFPGGVPYYVVRDDIEPELIPVTKQK